MFRFSNAIIFFRLWQRYHDRKGGEGGGIHKFWTTVLLPTMCSLFLFGSHIKRKRQCYYKVHYKTAPPFESRPF